MTNHLLQGSNFREIRNTRPATDCGGSIRFDIMHYFYRASQFMANTSPSENIFLYLGKLSIRKTFTGKMFEFEFLISTVSGADRNLCELGIRDGMFLWARRKPKHPFQYFERGLRIRAAKIGVKL